MFDEEAGIQHRGPVRQICTLLFGDGKEVSGEILAATRFGELEPQQIVAPREYEPVRFDDFENFAAERLDVDSLVAKLQGVPDDQIAEYTGDRWRIPVHCAGRLVLAAPMAIGTIGE